MHHYGDVPFYIMNFMSQGCRRNSTQTHFKIGNQTVSRNFDRNLNYINHKIKIKVIRF